MSGLEKAPAGPPHLAGALVTQVTFFPAGFDPADPDNARERRNFAVTVVWVGPDNEGNTDRYRVGRGLGPDRWAESLSHTGRWLPAEERYRQWTRHPFARAVELARVAVEERAWGGRTWAEFAAWRDECRAKDAARRAAEAKP